jgi:small subunit ribosomal protein S1
MVNKTRYHDDQISPPPMDESWWEAVLTEEETLGCSSASRVSRPMIMSPRWEEEGSGKTESEVLDWEQAIELYDQDMVTSMLVTSWNRGGLLVSGDQLQGFVPISHLIESPCQADDIEEWLARYVDRTLDLKVIECDQERGRVVLSERAAQSSPGSRNRLLQNLAPGSCATGTVTNITDFGVFVDLGGVEGLVHVSEISWGRVQHPTEVVSLGQQVVVYVINVDPKRARVALSLKRLHSNPWESAEERYFPGQITDAVITSIVPFGAFARLEEGLDGLIHVSEITENEELEGISGLQEGQQVKVRILHVNASKQRLGLSLKINGENEIEITDQAG